MTANAMAGDHQNCLQAGMDAYIPKPVHPSRLFQTIEELAANPANLEADNAFAWRYRKQAYREPDLSSRK